MKFIPCSALAVLAVSLLVYLPANAQNTIATDSLTVEWEQLDGPPGYVFKYGEMDGKMFAGTEGGLYFSTDGGKNWKFNKGLGIQRLMNFVIEGDMIFAAIQEETLTQGFGGVISFDDYFSLYRSLDRGETWEKTLDSSAPSAWFYNLRLSSSHRPDITVTNDSIVTLTLYEGDEVYNSRSFSSSNRGTTWQEFFYDMRYVLSINDTIAGIQHDDNNGWDGFILNRSGVQIVEMGGLSLVVNDIVRTAYLYGTFYIVLKNRTLYQSNDLGVTWSTQLLPVQNDVREVSWLDGFFYFHTNAGAWRSDLNQPLSFVQVYAGEGGSTLDPLSFSATVSGYWANSHQYKSLFSNDGGASWEERDKGLVSKAVSAYSYCGILTSYAFRTLGPLDLPVFKYTSNQQDGEWALKSQQHFRILGEANGIAYAYPPLMQSKDCGATWDTTGYPDINIQAAPEPLVQDGNRLYLWNKFGVPIHFSDDNGDTWLEIQGPVQFADCRSFLAFGDTLLFHTASIGPNSIYWSYDNGLTWVNFEINPKIRRIYAGENGKLIGINEGYLPTEIYISTDRGTTWSLTFSTTQKYPYIKDQNFPRIRFPYITDGTIFMHAANGLFISHNEGIDWTRLDKLPFFNYSFDLQNNTEVFGTFTEGAFYYFIDEEYLYAVTEYQGIWRTPYAPIFNHIKVQSAEYGFLKGRLYRDADGDCQYNLAAGDKPLGQKPVLVNPGNILANTDANGLYNLALPIGNYTVTATTPTYYTTTCANDTVSAAISLGNTVTADLPYSPIPGIQDLCVLITTPVAARPGFDVTYKLQVSNVGTAASSPSVLSFLFDDQWLQPLSVTPFGQFFGNQATIPLPSISPGDVVIITLTFNVLQSTPLGWILTFTANCPVLNDANPANNSARATQMVRGSYDPNDKNAQPITVLPPGQPRVLDYLIRFQNTGTDTAFTVVVTDTIQDGLNLMTLKTMEASHNFEFSILPGRVCKWRFRNILLADSNTNETASHGYLRFQIETNAGLLPGTPIRNDADIFFDFNSPVRTNEATSDNPKWVVTEASSIVLCAGDSWNGTVWTNSEILLDTVGNAWSDTITVVNLAVLPTWEVHFDTIVGQGAVLFNVPVLHDTTFTFEYFSSEGCDSTITWNVTVQTSQTKDATEASYQFDLRPNPTTDNSWLIVNQANFADTQSLDIRLHNASGMLMRSWNNALVSTSTPIILEMGDLPAGMYFVVVQSEKFHGMRRLVKL